MADFFANATLKKKLTGIIMLVCSIVLFLSSAAFIGAEIFSFRKVMIGNSASLAEVIAANSSIALTFEDPVLAQNTLTSLESEPNIQLAYIFDIRNQPFARYYRKRSTAGQREWQQPELSREELVQLADGIRAGKKSYRFSSNHLATFSPVYSDGNLVGMVYLNADMSPFYNWLHFFGGAAFVVVGISFLIAYLLSLRLQDLVSRPILYLVDKMNLVKTEEDFTIRAEKSSEDEVGTLVDGFNSMLSRVEERDEQLERYRHHLEDLVCKRTAELHSANCKLQQTIVELENAKAKIEAASRAKSQFLASISHELRTPMVGVLGTTELLMGSELDAHQRNLVETLNDSGEGLLTILNDLLDLSKIEAGKLTLETVDFNLLEVIETPLQLFGKSACDKNLELIFHCETNVPVHLQGDPGRLRQVIFNLVGNAIKFTPSGEIVLHVRVEREDATQVSLRFEVRDTGIGIVPEAQQKIFEAFSQADDSVTRKFGGTGLGLSIVRQLVEKMGGRIELSSEPGKGSVFHFTLDLAKQARPEETRPHRLRRATGQRVLVVDDSLRVCQMLREHLAALGFDVETSRKPDEAMSLLVDAAAVGRPFTIVMLDADLVEGGSHRLAELLAEPRFSGIRMIGLKCRNNPSDRISGGSAVSIYKPLLPSRVEESVVRVLEKFPSISGEEEGQRQSGELGEHACCTQGGKPRGRILVAEDNPTTQNLLKISLTSAGHDVVVAGNGRSALEIWQKSSFDLVLMDFNMPEMDGCTVARQMRSKGWKLPIVGLTAHSSENYFEQCREAGMDDCLCKPFKQKDLHQVVQKWLSQSVLSAVG
jgi:two-component system sensor histidine kinase BarA